MTHRRPNVLFIMADQLRFDTISALGNDLIYTPNLDRLVERGVSFTNAYSTCPVCVPARYTVRTGCEPPTTAIFSNRQAQPTEKQADTILGRCGPYLAQQMHELGYRTFGVGKFHSRPWDEDLGYEVQLHSEELYRPGQREGDSYARWIANAHPEYDFQEGLMGERTEMYYMPQMSHTPAEIGVEHWAAQRTIEQIRDEHARPYFGFVSFVGPYPPFAPPVPFNRMYDPDRMGAPILGDPTTDHMDQQIPWMNRIIWAEDINDPWFRILKARYYGEISYIDWCIGKILDAIEERKDADNTLICFFSDHGEHLGDHHGWQKESFFEESCRIPYLVSWPDKLMAGTRSNDLVCLTDLFGVATGAAGAKELREGVDLIDGVDNVADRRSHLVGYHGIPGTRAFKTMVRNDNLKYIYFANGGLEQLFDLGRDKRELCNIAGSNPAALAELREVATEKCASTAAVGGGALMEVPFKEYSPEDNPNGIVRTRIYQFDASRGVTGFPEHPADVMEYFNNR